MDCMYNLYIMFMYKSNYINTNKILLQLLWRNWTGMDKVYEGCSTSMLCYILCYTSVYVFKQNYLRTVGEGYALVWPCV